MLEAIMAKIADMLRSWGVGRLIDRISGDDRGIRILRRLGLISANPKQSFDSIYAYTLAEYGSVKRPIIQRFFRHQFIKNAYKKSFEQKDYSPIYEEAKNFLEWWDLAPQLHRIRFDYQYELKEFSQIFKRLVSETRTPVEIMQEQSTEQIVQKLDLSLHKGDQILEAIHNQKQLVLDFEWFRAKFDKQFVLIKDKYNTELHTSTNVDKNIHALLGDKEQLERLQTILNELRETRLHFSETLHFFHTLGKNIQPTTTIRASEEFDTLAEEFITIFQNTLQELESSNFEYIQSLQLENNVKQLNSTISEYADSEIKFQSGIVENTHRSLDRLTRFRKLTLQFINDISALKQTSLHILGKAGVGKTHLAAHICSERINNGLPAILLSGRQFTSDAPIQEQLRQILDIPPSHSWREFLQALSHAAKTYHTRIPIIIDGLNESTYHGAFSHIWRIGLDGLQTEVSSTNDIVLITTCRETYKDVIWPLKPKDTFVLSRGFDAASVKEAIKKYFEWYKIRADLTADTLIQFEHPIYLSIFCITKNPSRQEEVYVGIGQDSIFSIYEEFLIQTNLSINEKLGLRPNTPTVMKALTKLGEYLLLRNVRSIPVDTAVEMMDGKSRDLLEWEKSKSRALEHEGLLFYRDWGENQEELYFTHDLLAGYIIATHIIYDGQKDYISYLNSDRLLRGLFSEDYQQLHPLHEDICRCLAALLPAKTGQYLHEMITSEKALTSSINALFEMDPKLINEKAISLVGELFKKQENRYFLLENFSSTLGYVGHPLSATFWTKLLCSLSMVERDISWTEYIRVNERIFSKIVRHLEEPCIEHAPLTVLANKHLELYAEGVMWILTSTVRPLRDKATRALYWFGRRFPEYLLKLTKLSLTIDDPYISERMLAAVYGVVMARHYDFTDKNFVNQVLPIYARELFDAFFNIHAPFSTTHILSRDYALRTIQIAILHHTNLLSEQEKLLITPPFHEGGIREWGQINKNGELHEPIRMDFGNYTVGQLIPHRRNYDFQNEEYKVVLSNLYWRIIDLGYEENIFKEADSEISQDNQLHSRHDDGNKTDRYGKKYSWIAFFELAGYRQDLNPSHKTDDENRLSNVDIDPSFPEEVAEFELIKRDFLGDRAASNINWISQKESLDISSYSAVDNLLGYDGKWVLLDGYFSQEDPISQRKLFIFPRGFLLDRDIVNDFTNKMSKQDIGNLRLPEIPEDYYSYAGEIPWADTYPYNGSEIVEIVINQQEDVQAEEKMVVLRNGVPVAKEEYVGFWDKVIDWANKNNSDELEVAVETIAADMGLVIEMQTEQATTRTPQSKEFELQIPVRRHSWESYHSITNPGHGALTLSKEICEHLHLQSRPQTYNLFDEFGQPASIYFHFGDKWHSFQSFIFMRKDLLDRYLVETKKSLIWLIWGEKSIKESESNVTPRNINYQQIQEITLYKGTP